MYARAWYGKKTPRNCGAFSLIILKILYDYPKKPALRKLLTPSPILNPL
jgi:hypothetical protein